MIKNKNKKIKRFILINTIALQILFYFMADLCISYNELNDSNRKSSYETPPYGPLLCDDKLPEGWYRFVGAAGAKMATTKVDRFHCGTAFPGWLNDAHPTLEEGKASRKVCFSDGRYIFIDVKKLCILLHRQYLKATRL